MSESPLSRGQGHINNNPPTQHARARSSARLRSPPHHSESLGARNALLQKENTPRSVRLAFFQRLFWRKLQRIPTAIPHKLKFPFSVGSTRLQKQQAAFLLPICPLGRAPRRRLVATPPPTPQAFFVQTMFAWSAKTGRASSRRCKDARFYGFNTTVGPAP